MRQRFLGCLVVLCLVLPSFAEPASFSLPAACIAQAGTVIQAADWNTCLAAIAAAINGKAESGGAVPVYTKAGLPSLGTTGQLSLLADDILGLQAYQGAQWIAVNGGGVNVKAFGARGDGITDDTAAIQAAATVAIGKTLLFPPGLTYLITTVNIGAGTTVLMDGATIKQKVLAGRDGSPIFNVTGPNVTFRSGTLNGQRATQPPDGFADAFNTGPNNTGRAYRAGIKADAVVNVGITNLRVEGVTFTELYGAGVATLDVPSVAVTGCSLHDSNFELAMLARSAGTLTDAWVTDNQIINVGSGHASVNSSATVISGYGRVTFRGNHAHNTERTMVKIENSSSISILDNILDTNTKDTFCGLQVQVGSTTNRILIKGNILYNVKSGIHVQAPTVGLAINTLIIANTEIHTTTGSGVSDGIVVAGLIAQNVIVQGNVAFNTKRNGISIIGQVSRLLVDGNIVSGQANPVTWGIWLGATIGKWGSAKVTNNHLENFEQSAVGGGMLSLQRDSTHTFAHLTIQGNTILAGGARNRAIYANGVDIISSGLVSDNYVDGRIEPNTTQVETRNNTQTGAGAGNVAIVGKTQATVRAAGGTSAAPATPTGYAIINKDGTEYVIPYFAK